MPDWLLSARCPTKQNVYVVHLCPDAGNTHLQQCPCQFLMLLWQPSNLHQPTPSFSDCTHTNSFLQGTPDILWSQFQWECILVGHCRSCCPSFWLTYLPIVSEMASHTLISNKVHHAPSRHASPILWLHTTTFQDLQFMVVLQSHQDGHCVLQQCWCLTSHLLPCCSSNLHHVVKFSAEVLFVNMVTAAYGGGVGESYCTELYCTW